MGEGKLAISLLDSGKSVCVSLKKIIVGYVNLGPKQQILRRLKDEKLVAENLAFTPHHQWKNKLYTFTRATVVTSTFFVIQN